MPLTFVDLSTICSARPLEMKRFTQMPLKMKTTLKLNVQEQPDPKYPREGNKVLQRISLSQQISKPALGYQRSDDSIQFDFNEDHQQYISLESLASRASILWTQQKLKKAKNLFEMLELKIQGVSMRSIAQELELGLEEIQDAFLIFKNDHSMKVIARRILAKNNKKCQNPVNTIYIAHLTKIIERDGTLTIQMMTDLLNSQLRRENHPFHRADLEVSRVSSLLRHAGFTCRKLLSVPAEKNTPQNIEKRYHYAVFYKKLVETGVKMYYYHQAELGKNSVRHYGWARKGQDVKVDESSQEKLMIRCLLSPQKIASWVLRTGVVSKYHFEYLLEDLSKNGVKTDVLQRKILIVDRRRLGASRQPLSSIAQEKGFDLVGLPPISCGLNPIQVWFNKLHGELRYLACNKNKKDLMKESELVLNKYGCKCMSVYLDCVPSSIERCLEMAPI